MAGHKRGHHVLEDNDEEFDTGKQNANMEQGKVTQLVLFCINSTIGLVLLITMPCNNVNLKATGKTFFF